MKQFCTTRYRPVPFGERSSGPPARGPVLREWSAGPQAALLAFACWLLPYSYYPSVRSLQVASRVVWGGGGRRGTSRRGRDWSIGGDHRDGRWVWGRL